MRNSLLESIIKITIELKFNESIVLINTLNS